MTPKTLSEDVVHLGRPGRVAQVVLSPGDEYDLIERSASGLQYSRVHGVPIVCHRDCQHSYAITYDPAGMPLFHILS